MSARVEPVETAYDWEREEHRDALRGAPAYCYRHDYRPDRRGGGICCDCGDTLSAEEI